MKKLHSFLFFILINFVLQELALAAIKPNQTMPIIPPNQIEKVDEIAEGYLIKNPEPSIETKKIEKIIHDYLVNNPEVLIEASKKLQEKELAKEKTQLAEINANLPKYKNQIFDPNAPGRVVLGNPQGKIIIAEFTQHQCPHCKVAKPIVDDLLKNNPEVQLIIIYWPFFGKDASYTAKAVLAAQKQNKFHELEQAIFTADGFVSTEKANTIIKALPTIDQKKLFADITSPELDAGLKANFKLAENLKLIGTPSFIFTNKNMKKFSLVPGQTQTFKQDLNNALNAVQ